MTIASKYVCFFI
uniref:Uncharacterized protein n=1 Tax=Anguilla anguilla TaxID=7936 RepID=A0A0E9TJJ0_ANGAN